MPALGLGLGLAFADLRSLDADARAYIAAVKAAGGTVTAGQTTAINNFIKAEKAASRYTNLKRMYLPIWGVAAANAIDIVTRASGTFVGGVTHAAGYVEGNGSTGYMRSDVSPDGVGRTSASGLDFILINQANSNALGYLMGGTSNSFARRNGFLTNTTAITALQNSVATGAAATQAIATQNGILCSSRTSTTLLDFYQRKTSGITKISTSTTLESVAAPTTRTVFMARAEDSDAAVSSLSNARNGAYGFGLGMTEAQVTAFTSNLKTLWETCTGLTLP